LKAVVSLLPFGIKMGLGSLILAPFLVLSQPPQAVPSVSPSSSASGLPQTIATPPPKPLTKEESAKLLREYSQAQWAQLQALKHRQGLERREFEATLAPRRAEFQRNEETSKREFFHKNRDANSRRRFMDQAAQRQKQFETQHNAEIEKQTKQFIARAFDLQKSQERRMVDFRKALSEGKHPDAKLWPEAGW